MELTNHEQEALKESIEKYIPILEEQIKDLSKMKHAGSQDKKEIRRRIELRMQLLKDILKKL